MNDYTTFVDYITTIILKIPTPKIILSDTMLSDTNLAYADIKGYSITIKSNIPNHLDAFFAISHELRHLWQAITNPELYFNDYKPLNELDTEAYNLQLAEIDANAFAMVCMITGFDCQPLFQGLSDNVKKEIKKRANEIVGENDF